MRPGSENRMSGAMGRLFRNGTAAGLSDAQLLEQFLLRHDEAAEAAFAALVQRHGSMVLASCRRVLNDPHDAQDAFQATFLVLARKAGTIRQRGSIADWLRGVALRVAARARADTARRRVVERGAGAGSATTYVTTPADRDLWDEVDRLPRDLRAAVLLCYVEGLTHEEAARRLDWPVGTVRSRLARARDRLRTRLTRRGLAPGAPFVPLLSSRGISLPEGFVDATVRAAMLVAARDAAEAGLVPASAAALTEGVLRTMFMTKLKTVAVTLLAAGAVTCGIGSHAGQGPEQGATPRSPASPPGKVEQSPSPTGTDDGFHRRLIEILRAQGLFEQTHAAKLEELARHARQAQEREDPHEVVRVFREIESVVSAWREVVMGRRQIGDEKEELPTASANVLGRVSRSPGAGRDVYSASPGPVAGNVNEQTELPRSRQPASADRRLEELERKVDRLARALEEEQGEGGGLDPWPTHRAPPNVKGWIKKVDDRSGRVEIDIGSDDGLVQGHKLFIYRVDRGSNPVRPRPAEYIGWIRVMVTDPDQAVARAMEILGGKKIEEGDTVSARGPEPMGQH